MKLEQMEDINEPGYPSLRVHTEKRKSFAKTLGIGLLGAMAAGCSGPATGGVMAAPDQPNHPGAPDGPVPIETPKMRGEMVAPAPPPVLDGEMMIPEPPPQIKGDMVMPTQPLPTPMSDKEL